MYCVTDLANNSVHRITVFRIIRFYIELAFACDPNIWLYSEQKHLSLTLETPNGFIPDDTNNQANQATFKLRSNLQLLPPVHRVGITKPWKREREKTAEGASINYFD